MFRTTIPQWYFIAPRPGFFVGGAIRFGFFVNVGVAFRPWGWGYNRFDWARARSFRQQRSVETNLGRPGPTTFIPTRCDATKVLVRLSGMRCMSAANTNGKRRGKAVREWRNTAVITSGSASGTKLRASRRLALLR